MAQAESSTLLAVTRRRRVGIGLVEMSHDVVTARSLRSATNHQILSTASHTPARSSVHRSAAQEVQQPYGTRLTPLLGPAQQLFPSLATGRRVGASGTFNLVEPLR